MLRYIYGYHPVMMALEKNSLIKVKKVFILQKKYKEIIPKLKELNIDYEIQDLQKMNNILQTTKHQGIYLEVKSYNYFDIDQIFKRVPKNKYYRFLICDKITDPYNFGSILRIAAGNDFDALIVLNRNQAVVNSVVAKTAAGALSIVPICEVNSLNVLINNLKQKNFWILAADKNDQAVDYHELKYDFNLGLIIGSEGSGVSNSLIKHSDYVVKIPMSDNLESFNASVACGIICNNIYLKTINTKSK